MIDTDRVRWERTDGRIVKELGKNKTAARIERVGVAEPLCLFGKNGLQLDELVLCLDKKIDC
jgi:hypothetical protein